LFTAERVDRCRAYTVAGFLGGSSIDTRRAFADGTISPTDLAASVSWPTTGAKHDSGKCRAPDSPAGRHGLTIS
jgi:hypothetical protein